MISDKVRLLRRSDEVHSDAVPPQPRGDLSESGPMSTTRGDARVMHGADGAPPWVGDPDVLYAMDRPCLHGPGGCDGQCNWELAPRDPEAAWRSAWESWRQGRGR